MPGWDFSEYTTAQLATLQTNIQAKLNDLLTGSKSGSLDGAAFSEMSLSELQSLQSAVNAELRSRGSTIDDDFMAVEFETAGD